MVARVGQSAPNRGKIYFREWRKARGLTQQQLADMLDSVKSTISDMETGKTMYNQSSLEAWAAALGCEPRDLISRPPDEEDLYSLFRQAPPDAKHAALYILRPKS